jgi:hypothetical protein
VIARHMSVIVLTACRFVVKTASTGFNPLEPVTTGAAKPSSGRFCPPRPSTRDSVKEPHADDFQRN